MKARRATSTHEALRRTTAPREGQPKPKADKGVRNSFQAYNAIVDGHVERMGRTEGLLWLMLWRFENRKTGLLQVSIGTIAKLSGLSRRSVIRSLGAMVEKGYLVKVKQGSTDHSSNVYRLALPREK